MEYNEISNKCRTCLSESKVMFALFENYENDISLAHIINCFLNVQLNIYDNLPNKICQHCATLLIQFYNFSIIFEESNRRLNVSDEKNIHCFLEENVFSRVNFDEADFNEFDTKPFKEEETNDNVAQKVDYAIIHQDKSDNEICNNNKEVTIKSEHCDDFEEIVICTTNDPNYAFESDKHKCNVCNKNFKNLLLLKKHLQLHIHNKKFVCEICGYISLKKSYLADHMETHAADKMHKCNFCGKAFRRRSTFARHRRIHTNPLEIVCEMCGQKFTDRGTLKTHILLRHIKSRNFKCIICNRTFPLKATLNKHLRRHQQREGATKKFTCSECNMQYFDKSSLNRHYMAKHSGEHVRFKCQYCFKEYTTKTNLRKHVNAHHK